MTGSSGARRGFTLAETLVTLGIFAMVVVAVSNIYLLYNRAQRQTLAREKIIAEASVVLDEIARQVRTHEITFYGTFDYDDDPSAELLYSLDGDGPYTNGTSYINGSEIELALQDASGSQLVYLFNPGTLDYCTNPGLPGADPKGLYLFSGDSGKGINCSLLFNLPNIEMEDAKFYISPSYNPYPDSDTDCRLGIGVGTTFNGYYCACSTAAPVVTCPGASGAIACTDGRCQLNDAGQRDRQPRVTIVLKIRDQRNPTSPIILQTTVSSRVYKR